MKKHNHDYNEFLSQTRADEDGYYIQVMACKCGKVHNFHMNLFPELSGIEAIKAQDHEDACGDR